MAAFKVTIKECCDDAKKMTLKSTEDGEIVISFNHTNISYCPFCGTEIELYIYDK